MPDMRAVFNGRIFTPVIPATIIRRTSTLVVRAMIIGRTSTLVVRAMIIRRTSTLVVRATIIRRTITARRSQPQDTGFGSASPGTGWPGLQRRADSLEE